MLLTITTTYQPATDLGYLLHKNPAHQQTFELNFGRAHVFYPDAQVEKCTAALLLDINTIQLVRHRENAFALEQYVNDRPYVASSFLSVALAQVFGTALQGRCKLRPELVNTPLPLQATITALPCRQNGNWLQSLFEPLGYNVVVQTHQLDEQYPDWGNSPYFTVTLTATCLLRDLLAHLYVLIPVLDNDKHYWIGDDEVEKLLKHGKGWLEAHPMREHITYRYLKQRPDLAREALSRLIIEERSLLVEDKINIAPENASAENGQTTVSQMMIQAALLTTDKVERVSLAHQQRLEAVLQVLRNCGARRVLDLGCGEGRLLKMLMADYRFEHMLGLDVSYNALERAKERLHLDRLSPEKRARIELLHGSLIYADQRLVGYDAAAIVEVIEHLDSARLAAFERVIFDYAQPTTVIITTPNAEYNTKFATLAAGSFRHKDHRFEWTRSEFQTWTGRICERSSYTVQIQPIGEVDERVGALSQMAIFTRIK